MFDVVRIFILVALLVHPVRTIVPVVEAAAPFDVGNADSYLKKTLPTAGKTPVEQRADAEGDFPRDDKSYTTFRWYCCAQTCSFPQSKQCDEMTCGIMPISRFVPDAIAVAGQPWNRVSPKQFLSLSSSPRSPPTARG